MLHAVLHQLRQLLALRAPVEVEPLLGDALGPAGGLDALAAQAASPLQALLPEERVLRLVAGGGAPVAGPLLPGPLAVGAPALVAVLDVDGHLRLRADGGGKGS